MSPPRQVLVKMLRSAYPSWISGARSPEDRPAWRLWKPSVRNMVLAAAFSLPGLACSPASSPTQIPLETTVSAPAAPQIPVALGDPAALAASLKDKGWSAQEAWLWYTEYSALASVQLVSANAPDQIHQANAARAAMLGHLQQVETPAQMRDYLEQWPDRMRSLGAPAVTGDSSQALFWHHTGLDSWVALARMKSPACMVSDFDAAVIEMSIDWARLDQQLALDVYERKAFNLVEKPSEIDDRAAWSRLVKSFQDSGLRALRLPPGAIEASDYYNMAVALTASNTHLSTRTGWDGGVLGLSGRVSLVFMDPSAQVDAVARRDAHGSVIGMASGSGWSPLAHEWFHALDFELARLDPEADRLASATTMSGKGFEAWAALRQALVEPLNPSARELWRQELENHVAQRWPSVERQESLSVLRTAISDPRFNRDRTFMGMVEDDMMNGVPEANARIAAETFMVEAELMATGPDEKVSPWLFVLTQVERAAAASADLDNPAANQPFTSPAEMAAYAFEASFPGPHTPIISSGLAGWKPLRTPSQVEATRHAAAFDQLFLSMAPWWKIAQNLKPGVPMLPPSPNPTARTCPRP